MLLDAPQEAVQFALQSAPLQRYCGLLVLEVGSQSPPSWFRRSAGEGHMKGRLRLDDGTTMLDCCKYSHYNSSGKHFAFQSTLP